MSPLAGPLASTQCSRKAPDSADVRPFAPMILSASPLLSLSLLADPLRAAVVCFAQARGGRP
jgi:hypothetical protein